MTVRISFVEFLRTGKAGPIGIGATRADVAKVFGRPDAWEGRYEGKSPLRSLHWYHGGISFGFRAPQTPYYKVGSLRDVVDRIDLDPYRQTSSRVKVSHDGFDADRYMGDFGRFARRSGFWSAPIGNSLITSGGVFISFYEPLYKDSKIYQPQIGESEFPHLLLANVFTIDWFLSGYVAPPASRVRADHLMIPEGQNLRLFRAQIAKRSQRLPIRPAPRARVRAK